MSSPAIGQDGSIYFGSIDEKVYAVYPNGTLKWKFDTGNWIHGSATVGDDGTIYIGSDVNFYSLYPNNGTMKWKLGLGAVWNTPVIDKDGIIYLGTYDDGNFYAIYPNGTIKWIFPTGGRFWFDNSPALSAEGTIYFGTHSFGGGSSRFFALYPDGTEKWRKEGLGWFYSSPAVDENGVVYACSCKDEQHGGSIYAKGYLYAFGICELEADANGPYYGLINQPVQFKGSARGGYSPYVSWHWTFGDGGTSDEQNPIHTYTEAGNYSVMLTVIDNTSNASSDTTWAWIQNGNTPPDEPTIDGPTHGQFFEYYEYTFSAQDPEGTPVWYYVDWDDGKNTGWFGPSESGGEVVAGHWWGSGTFIIRCKAKDPYGDEGPWGELKVIMPRNKATHSSLFIRFLDSFPLLERLFSFLFVSFQ